MHSRLRSRHATPRAETAEATDWVRIADLYERLARVTGSPVVEVNRAVALGMAYGPEAGLALLDQLDGLPALSGYHLLPSVRGDLLDKLGRHEEAQAEFARAATMTQNERERRLLLGSREREVSRAGVTLGCRDGPATHPARTPPCANRRRTAGQQGQRATAHPRRRTPRAGGRGLPADAKASQSIPCCAPALPAPGKHSTCSNWMINSIRTGLKSPIVSTMRAPIP